MVLVRIYDLSKPHLYLANTKCLLGTHTLNLCVYCYISRLLEPISLDGSNFDVTIAKCIHADNDKDYRAI